MWPKDHPGWKVLHGLIVLAIVAVHVHYQADVTELLGAGYLGKLLADYARG